MDIKERIAELRQNIAKLSKMVEGLEHYEPYLLLVEEWKKIVTNADTNWHLLNLAQPEQQQTYHQLRSLKLAGLQLANSLDSFKYEISRANKEIMELENPDDIQSSYVDQE